MAIVAIAASSTAPALLTAAAGSLGPAGLDRWERCEEE